MIKLSKIQDMEDTIKIKDLNSAIKDYVLYYISDKTQDKGIKECNITFTCDPIQRDLPLDDIVKKIESRVQSKIIECVDEVINFSDIEIDPEYELEEELENYI